MLAIAENGGGRPELVLTSIASVDAEGTCELRSGAEVAPLRPAVSCLAHAHVCMCVCRLA